MKSCFRYSTEGTKMILTETQVRDRLRAQIAESGNQSAFAAAHDLAAPLVNIVLSGRYKGAGFPPSVLAALDVRKVTVYVLNEGKEKCPAHHTNERF
jgi:hypothetical protein